MTDLQNIQELVLEHDGHCRDVSLRTDDRVSAFELLKWFIEKYEIISSFKCVDGYFKRIEQNDYHNYILTIREADTLELCFRNPAETIQELQFYLLSENENTVFVEITFFPKDILLEKFNASELLATISEWRKLCDANDIYLRGEYASWKYGDVSKHSGVIYYEHAIET